MMDVFSQRRRYLRRELASTVPSCCWRCLAFIRSSLLGQGVTPNEQGTCCEARIVHLSEIRRSGKRHQWRTVAETGASISLVEGTDTEENKRSVYYRTRFTLAHVL